MRMKLLIIVAGTLIVTNLSAAVKEEENFSFSLEEGARLSLENINGSVTVVGGAGSEVEISAFKRADNQEALDGIEIVISESPDFLRIETKLPSNRGWFGGGDNGGARVTYELLVPANIHLDSISSVNGGIDIEGVSGVIKAETVNGSVDVANATGNTRLETVNGSIEAQFDALPPDQKISADSVNGKITIYLPAGVGASVTAETINGGIDGDDFKLAVDKGFVGRSMTGQIGDGGASISLDTVNGSIRLRSK